MAGQKVTAADELVREAVEGNTKARGLILIISNDYLETPEIALVGARKDARSIESTFESPNINFVTITRVNSTKKETIALIDAVTSFRSYRSDINANIYDCFAFFFSGHGNGKHAILASDKKEIDINEDVFKKFESEQLLGCKKLIFIDACRTVTGNPEQLKVPGDDFLLAYSTRYGCKAFANNKGSYWTQELAKQLKENKSLLSVITAVNKEVEQGAQFINSTVDITLCK